MRRLAWPEGRLDRAVLGDESGESHGQVRKGRVYHAEVIRFHTEEAGQPQKICNVI